MKCSDIEENKIIEPIHGKTNIKELRPAWIATRLRTRASGPMLFAYTPYHK
jgi:hypothetical protein